MFKCVFSVCVWGGVPVLRLEPRALYMLHANLVFYIQAQLRNSILNTSHSCGLFKNQASWDFPHLPFYPLTHIYFESYLKKLGKKRVWQAMTHPCPERTPPVASKEFPNIQHDFRCFSEPRIWLQASSAIAYHLQHVEPKGNEFSWLQQKIYPV